MQVTVLGFSTTLTFSKSQYIIIWYSIYNPTFGKSLNYDLSDFKKDFIQLLEKDFYFASIQNHILGWLSKMIIVSLPGTEVPKATKAMALTESLR